MSPGDQKTYNFKPLRRVPRILTAPLTQLLVAAVLSIALGIFSNLVAAVIQGALDQSGISAYATLITIIGVTLLVLVVVFEVARVIFKRRQEIRENAIAILHQREKDFYASIAQQTNSLLEHEQIVSDKAKLDLAVTSSH